ncbi:hypothetical protein [Acinetobacter courvalinii]|uniref:hypothetical protein n=1 Tax=Acinetobacter courvalinii TaxID=280147 RepID=UPI0028A28251|nr:hypothetical protein [Acinetobacter courvalinii]
MNITKFTTPFREFLLKDDQGFYHVRLGSKIFMAKVSLNYTPEFDKDFSGGAQAPKFEWYSVLVKDSTDAEPRQITTDELSIPWVKRELKRAVNEQRSKERNARNSQTSRYSANQRTAYHNARSN